MNPNDPDPRDGYRPDLDLYTRPDMGWEDRDEPQPRLRSGWWIIPLCIVSTIFWIAVAVAVLT